jgi:hypothetical protein
MPAWTAGFVPSVPSANIRPPGGVPAASSRGRFPFQRRTAADVPYVQGQGLNGQGSRPGAAPRGRPGLLPGAGCFLEK